MACLAAVEDTVQHCFAVVLQELNFTRLPIDMKLSGY